MLPFTREQFLFIFATYNTSVWPAQLIAYLVAAVIVVLLARPSKSTDTLIAAGLAAMWTWTGIAYHGLFFSMINKAAPIFAALFVLQAVLLVLATTHGRLRFGAPGAAAAWVGWALIVYSSVAYPLLGLWTGEHYPGMPLFGITPCPVTLFTFGLLLLTTAAVPWWLLVIPFGWSLLGGSAALLLGMPQDWLLPLGGVAVVLMASSTFRRPAHQLHGARS